MGVTIYIERAMNYLTKSKTERAGSKATSDWGLARLYKGSGAEIKVKIIENIRERIFKGEIMPEEAMARLEVSFRTIFPQSPVDVTVDMSYSDYNDMIKAATTQESKQAINKKLWEVRKSVALMDGTSPEMVALMISQLPKLEISRVIGNKWVFDEYPGPEAGEIEFMNSRYAYITVPDERTIYYHDVSQLGEVEEILAKHQNNRWKIIYHLAELNSSLHNVLVVLSMKT